MNEVNPYIFTTYDFNLKSYSILIRYSVVCVDGKSRYNNAIGYMNIAITF